MPELPDLEVYVDHLRRRLLGQPLLGARVKSAWRAGLSPLRLTLKMTGDEIARLHDAAQTTLTEWTTRLGEDAGQDW